MYSLSKEGIEVHRYFSSSREVITNETGRARYQGIENREKMAMQRKMKRYYRFMIQVPTEVLVAGGPCA